MGLGLLGFLGGRTTKQPLITKVLKRTASLGIKVISSHNYMGLSLVPRGKGNH